MNYLFYLKLAIQNIRKNAQTYVPYLLTCTGAVMMFDILMTLAGNPDIAKMKGGSDMRIILNLGCIIIAIFTGIFLFYTNSYLMKRRTTEIGLYNILGMEKKHIGWVLFFETVCIASVSLILGISGGFLLSRAVYLLLLRRRKEKIAEYQETMMNPYVAASRGYVDDVIMPSETRKRIISALEAFRGKRVQKIPKKHGNIPL